jgi:hypothetical protein
VLELILPNPLDPVIEGKLDEYVGIGPLVTVADLTELNGSVTGGVCVSGIWTGLLFSTGEFAADDICSLATSARGAKIGGFFGVVDDVGVVVVAGLGAGRV